MKYLLQEHLRRKSKQSLIGTRNAHIISLNNGLLEGWSPVYIVSRVSGRGYKNGAVCVSVWVCESYVVHHLVGRGLHCAPPGCVVHHRAALGTTGLHCAPLCTRGTKVSCAFMCKVWHNIEGKLDCLKQTFKTEDE